MLKVCPEIKVITDKIALLLEAELIYVFGVKRNDPDDNVTDFDVCVVTSLAENTERNYLLKRVYMEIESEIPYDIFLYSPTEWNHFTQNPSSFASRILRKGVIAYEK